MKKAVMLGLIVMFVMMGVLGHGSSTKVESVRGKLVKWRTGVWLSAGGTYTVWTRDHYFVLSMAGDTSNPNLYYGCSQVSYHEQGMTRHQVQRFRQSPGGNRTLFSENTLTATNNETPYSPDTTLFNPKQCVIKDGVIYDAVTEVTDSSIVLISCNGDREKLFSDGRSVYLPAGGGEFYSYRVEEF